MIEIKRLSSIDGSWVTIVVNENKIETDDRVVADIVLSIVSKKFPEYVFAILNFGVPETIYINGEQYNHDRKN